MRFGAICGVFLTIALLLRPETASADWAYPFVVYSGKAYVVTDSDVGPERIGRSIGRVERYSDKEGTYSGNFSNAFPKGTRYYEIAGMSENEGIAVRTEDGRYVLAEYEGEYLESFSDQLWRSKGKLTGGIAAAAVAVFIVGYARRKRGV